MSRSTTHVSQWVPLVEASRLLPVSPAIAEAVDTFLPEGRNP